MVLDGPRRQRLMQLGDVRSDAPRLVAGEQISSRAAAVLVLQVDVGSACRVLVRPDDGTTAPVDPSRMGKEWAAPSGI